MAWPLAFSFGNCKLPPAEQQEDQLIGLKIELSTNCQLLHNAGRQAADLGPISWPHGVCIIIISIISLGGHVAMQIGAAVKLICHLSTLTGRELHVIASGRQQGPAKEPRSQEPTLAEKHRRAKTTETLTDVGRPSKLAQHAQRAPQQFAFADVCC